MLSAGGLAKRCRVHLEQDVSHAAKPPQTILRKECRLVSCPCSRAETQASRQKAGGLIDGTADADLLVGHCLLFLQHPTVPQFFLRGKCLCRGSSNKCICSSHSAHEGQACTQRPPELCTLQTLARQWAHLQKLRSGMRRNPLVSASHEKTQQVPKNDVN